MSSMTRCLAVDDHPTVRQGLGLMFGLAPDLELVGSVENGEDVIEAVKRLRPEVLMSQVGPDAPLSEREREILQLLAEGLHTEEVARRIGLSTETVKSDTKRAILKLEADTRVHAVAIALRQAIIE